MRNVTVISNQGGEFNCLEPLKQYYPKSKIYDFSINSYHISIRSSSTLEVESYFIKQDNLSLIVVGEVYNLNRLKKIIMSLERDSILFNAPQIIMILYLKMGASAFSLLEGRYTLILFNEEDASIQVYTDLFGQMPFYYTIDSEKNIWLTNEIKSILKIKTIDFTLKNIENIKFNANDMKQSSIFKNITKLNAGICLTVKTKKSAPFHAVTNYHTFFNSKLLNLPENQAELLLEEFLLQSTEDCIGENNDIAIPLSGGLDSSLIASIAKTMKHNIVTVTMGTEQNNEFSFAREVSSYIGSNHYDITLDLPLLLDGLIHTIYYNEIHDAVCAEIQIPFYYIYKKISEFNKHVLTGYGADMLFAGHATPDVDLATLPGTLWSRFLKVQWRGEFSPFVGQRWGLSVRHPFCSNQMIAFAINLDPKLKVKNNQVKHILRNFAYKMNLLPEKICWRKKVAIEKASDINKMFAQYLGVVDSNEYNEKNKFTYKVFKKIFSEQVPPEELMVGTKLVSLINE